LSLAPLPAAAQPAYRPHLEITPMAGLRTGGELERSVSDLFDTNVKIDQSETFGIVVDIPLSHEFQIELLANRQESAFRADEGLFGEDLELADVSVENLQAGVLFQWGGGQVLPFVSLTLGAARIDPDVLGAASENRFAGTLGGGVKVFLSNHPAALRGPRLLGGPGRGQLRRLLRLLRRLLRLRPGPLPNRGLGRADPQFLATVPRAATHRRPFETAADRSRRVHLTRAPGDRRVWIRETKAWSRSRGGRMRAAIHRPALVAAATVGFLNGWLWYSPLLFGTASMRLRGLDPASFAEIKVPAALLVVEWARCLVVAYVLARLAALAGAVGRKRALGLAVLVWIGFPVTLLLGSAMWEQVPWQLAAIHAGDWLVKMVLMAMVLAAWPGPGRDGTKAGESLGLTHPPVATTGMLIRRPVADVFEAFVDPRITTQFWFTKSNGRLEQGKQIQWDWEIRHLDRRDGEGDRSESTHPHRLGRARQSEPGGPSRPATATRPSSASPTAASPATATR
jgi:hypothetical protein